MIPIKNMVVKHGDSPLPRISMRSGENGAGWRCTSDHWGFHKWGYPNNWMVYFMENPKMDHDLGILHIPP